MTYAELVSLKAETEKALSSAQVAMSAAKAAKDMAACRTFATRINELRRAIRELDDQIPIAHAAETARDNGWPQIEDGPYQANPFWFSDNEY